MDSLSANWKELWIELKRRLKKPLGYPSFVFYFLGIIILIGGLGVWISIYKKTWDAVPRDLSTYLLAILSSAAADLILSEGKKQSLQMFSILTLVIGGFLSVLSEANSDLTRAYIYAILGAFLALLLWWIANADNAKLFGENPPPNAATGGDPNIILGNLSGIEV
jgi:hypothetical protein